MIATEAPRTRSLTVPVVVLVVAIAFAPALVAGGLAAAMEVAAARDDAVLAPRDAAVARGDVGSARVILALEGERLFAGTALLGLDDDVEQPFASMDEAAAATDDAIAAARAGLRERGGPGSAALDRALTGLAPDLADLRARAVGPGNIDRTPEVQDLDAAYAAAIDALDRADRELTASIDDPVLRRGAALVDLAARQERLRGDLVRILVLAVTGSGLDTDEDVAAASTARGEMVANDAEIARLATGPYRAPAAELAADPDIAAFGAEVDAALASPAGPSDIVDVAELGSDGLSAYQTFIVGVVNGIDDRADDVGREAFGRRTAFSALAVAALLAGVAVLAGAVAWLAIRARRARAAGP
jgi:hypothetical protein